MRGKFLRAAQTIGLPRILGQPSMNSKILLVSIGLLGLANIALGQYVQPQVYNRPVFGYRDYNLGGYNMGYLGGFAATPGQAAAYGASALVRSQAAANQMNAEAAVIAQQAKREALETQKKSTETFFELRRMNAEYRAEEDARRAAARKSNGGGTPAPVALKGLTLSQLDPVTGRIGWTPILMEPEFKNYRDGLDAMFKSRAELGAQLSLGEVQSFTRPMRQLLDTKANDVAPLDWIAAKRLVEGLEQEIRIPLG